MKIKKETLSISLLLASGVVLPLSFIVDPYLFLGLLLFSMVGLLVLLDSAETRLWVIYLYAFQYFGVTIFGLKLYDVVSVYFLAALLWRGKLNKKVIFHPHVLLFVIFLVYICTFTMRSAAGAVEAVRYIMCLLILILFGHNQIEFDKLKKYLLVLAIINLVQGIFLHVIIYNFLGDISVDTESVKVALYYSLREPRISGFADDPNKYYIYSFCIILLYELLDKENTANSKITRIVCLATAFISLSRAGILIGASYWAMHFVYRSFFARRHRKVFNTIVFTVVALLIINFNPLLDLVNYLVEELAHVTGRTRTLEYEPNVTSGNRMFIWKESFSHFTNSPLVGNGMFFWEDTLPFPPHNTVLVLLMDVGLIGFALYLLSTFPLQRKIVTYPFFLIYLLTALTLDMQHYRLYFILLAVIMFYAQPSPKNTTCPA